METYFVLLGTAIILLMFLTLLRVIKGPTAIDRLIGVNMIGTKATLLIIIIGASNGRVDMFIDIAIAYALLNFMVSLATARFFQRTRFGGGIAKKEEVEP
ncbi:MAG: pH regulation protein F [Desulfocapsa sp.]|nr:pH regulation protein F [Desulfocapsa sp.]MBN4060034.1 pH regulation protein F [Desulfotalea psychrophila]